MRVDIYDLKAEQTGGPERKVAEVHSDGTTGKLTILDPSLTETLREIFEQPQVVVARGDVDEDGTAYDSLPEELPPWQRETLIYIVESVLGEALLRGEIQGDVAVTVQQVVPEVKELGRFDDDRILVGKSPECQVQFSGVHGISHIHAVLEWREGRLWVSDPGARHPVQLNGEVIPLREAVPVSTGDKLKLGHVEIELTF